MLYALEFESHTVTTKSLRQIFIRILESYGRMDEITIQIYDRIVSILFNDGICLFVCMMVLNATFNNISVISWLSVLLVDKTRGPGENHRPVASHRQIYHIMLYISPWSRFITTSVVIGTDCIGSYKYDYHTIKATTAP